MATIKDIAKALVAKHQLKQADAEEFVQQIVEVINEGLLQDRQVKIKGFGTFKLQVVKERSSVNVNTGERVTIGEHSKVTFTPDAVMRDTINKPFAQFETTVIDEDNPLLDEMPAETENEEEDADVEEPVQAEEKVEKQPETKVEEPAKVIEPVKEEVKVEAKPEAKVEEPAKPEVKEEAKPEVKEEVKPEAKEEPKPQAPKTEVKKEQAEVIKFVDEKPAETIKFTEDDQPEENAAAGESFFAKNKKMLLICCAAVVLLLCIIALSKSGAFESEPEPVVVEQKDTVAAEPVAEEINLDVCNQDPRVSTGAYKIVGVKEEITVKEGQTLSKISQDYFGPGMVCYLEAMNQTKEVKPGDKIKIPEIAPKSISKKKKLRRGSRSQGQAAASAASAE